MHLLLCFEVRLLACALLLLLSNEPICSNFKCQSTAKHAVPKHALIPHITCVCWHAGQALLKSPEEEALLPVEP